LLFVGAEQDHNGAFTSGLQLAPIRTQSRSPRCNRGLKSIFASTTAGQNEHTTRWFCRQLGAAGALAKQIDLTRLSEWDAVEQLGDDGT
jgi:hypothetical protein